MFGFGKTKETDATETTTEKSLDINEESINKIILQSIEDGVFLVDANGTIVSFNQGAQKITGWQVKDAIGLNYASILKFIDSKGQEYAEEDHPINRTILTKQTIRDNSVEIVTHSKKSLPVFISVSPIIAESGETNGVVGVFRDVSKERSEESQRAEFISTASHEMRTPVAAIEGYLALAMNENVAKIDTKAREYLAKAHTSTQHLGKLFQDLLTAAKSEDGRLTNNPRVVEMSAFIQEVADANKFVAEKKGLVVELLLGSQQAQLGAPGAQQPLTPLYYTHIDPDRMREVVTNLFDNAVKYTESGKVTFALTGDEKIVQIRVSDTGPGIPAEDIPHLFQKFYRVDNSATRSVGGTGLGLFISKKIVELYQGRIWAESELDKGSTFYINLPRISTSRAQQLLAQEAAKPNAVQSTQTGF